MTEPTGRVLIVDDDPAVREIVGAILRRGGLLTDLASDGEEAVVFLKKTAYSAVLLDLMMPRMTGSDVIHFMKEAGVSTPVIVMTAVDDQSAFDLDPSLVRLTMKKPIAIGDLRSVVDAVLRASNHQ